METENQFPITCNSQFLEKEIGPTTYTTDELKTILADMNKLANENAQVLQQAMEDTQKASRAINELLVTISDEIDSPLSSILDMAREMSKGNLDATQRKYIETLMQSGRALMEAIQDAHNIAKVEAIDEAV